MKMNDDVDVVGSGTSEAYETLEENDDVESYQQISPSDRDQFDFAVSINGTEYGVNVSKGQAEVMDDLSQYDDTEVNRTRPSRGSASAGVLTPQTETMTVEEAATALDSRDPSEVQAPGTDMEPQERSVEDSVTASRYGKRKVAEEGNW